MRKNRKYSKAECLSYLEEYSVAVTTIQKADPVTVETKVTMICLPDFPTADQVYIADVIV